MISLCRFLQMMTFYTIFYRLSAVSNMNYLPCVQNMTFSFLQKISLTCSLTHITVLIPLTSCMTYITVLIPLTCCISCKPLPTRTARLTEGVLKIFNSTFSFPTIKLMKVLRGTKPGFYYHNKPKMQNNMLQNNQSVLRRLHEFLNLKKHSKNFKILHNDPLKAWKSIQEWTFKAFRTFAKSFCS